jgi:hypothetical protein
MPPIDLPAARPSLQDGYTKTDNTRGSPADAGSPLAEICRRVATPEVARAVTALSAMLALTALAAFLTCRSNTAPS